MIVPLSLNDDGDDGGDDGGEAYDHSCFSCISANPRPRIFISCLCTHHHRPDPTLFRRPPDHLQVRRLTESTHAFGPFLAMMMCLTLQHFEFDAKHRKAFVSLLRFRSSARAAFYKGDVRTWDEPRHGKHGRLITMLRRNEHHDYYY